jgi:hypothetical protein
MSCSCWAYSGASSEETFATMAATCPEESVPWAQAAAVSGNWARRTAITASRWASRRERRPWAASQEVRDSDPSALQACSASKRLRTSLILASKRSLNHIACSISCATGTTTSPSTAPARSARLTCPTSPSYTRSTN